ncbi:3-methyl-2-oxobutanoate hydroxymethyltransferase [bacterium]|nr:3-methyl-2-oxobutanoate hydroxymethyltransferase [bacterium]
MRKSIQKIQSYKEQGKKITVLTAYDYSSAKYIDEAGVDIVLVGDSLAQVVLGYDSTYDISMTEMKIFTSAVSRAVKNARLVCDMPFASFQIDKKETMKNACELIKCGVNAVKIEGCNPYILDCVKHMTQNGIPVMGHLGYTPMSINTLGGHKIQGKNASRTLEILQDAKKLQEAGCFSIVFELMPKESAKYITQNLEIPTIGIGCGPDCDGQVLVSDDVFGKYDRFKPKFARQYSNLKEILLKAAKEYCRDVENGSFPSKEESFELEREECKKLENN